MYILNDSLRLSASDLINFLECEHLTHLDRERAGGRLEVDLERDPTAVLVGSKGDEHEAGLLKEIEAAVGDVVVIDTGPAAPGPSSRLERLATQVAETDEAMRAGVSVIHQAALWDGPTGRWAGYADFLVRRDGVDSQFGDYAYEPADAKLARSLKPYFVLQLCLYADLLAGVQGRHPERFEVLLGSGETSSLRLADFHAYHRRIVDLFERTIDDGIVGTYPLPTAHCGLCGYKSFCEQRRDDDDHLSLVAGLGRDQVVKFEQVHIRTVAGLANAADAAKPKRMTSSTFGKLRSQATLQDAHRGSGEHSWEVLEPERDANGAIALRGFGLLPPSSPGDLFFDIEGDPFFGSEGLEYLWGVAYADAEAVEERFDAFWGRDVLEEKKAFEAFVDFVVDRRSKFPDMHVYHYASYEQTAAKRMVGLHATREEEVDELLRASVFVDLYQVVRQGMRLSYPSYSLKYVERFFMPEREEEVTDGGDSIIQFERWLEHPDETEILDAIELYNRFDCIATLRLRDWLLDRREEAIVTHGVEIPWRGVGHGEPSENQAGAAEEIARLQAELTADVPAERTERDPLQQAGWLLAQEVDYHRREAKPAYWELIARCARSADELVTQDSEAIGGLEPVGDPIPVGGRSRSVIQTFRFPEQEHKIREGAYVDPLSAERDDETGLIDPFSANGCEVVAMRAPEGSLDLKLGPKAQAASLPRSLCPGKPYDTKEQRGAIRELGETVARDGLDPLGRYPCARQILMRRPPTTAAVPTGEPLQSEQHDLDRAVAIASGLEDSHLFVQGPPGSGKTFTGAQMILELLSQGRRVGIAAPSHKAICNLLAEVEKHAPEDPAWRGLKKGKDDQEFNSVRPDPLIGNSTSGSDFADPDAPLLLAGTAWLWCREDMRERVDTLVIDEAGQVSLADALALATAARNVILLGDPLQLAQVSQALHPDGSGRSVLEHLLGEDETVPGDRGLFIDETRRMHPDVCEFVSDAFYGSRLHSWEGTANQRVDANGDLTGTGIRYLPVEHEGNTRSSDEEADVVAAQIASLEGANYRDDEGEAHELMPEDIMVVTPYNAQVRLLGDALPDGVRIGTVDKFQGQQAQVVFFSMATSSSEEIPRGVDFLYSRNRLNVAVSRARCLAVLVCSPNLLTIRCRTVDQMRLVNSLCLLAEKAQG